MEGPKFLTKAFLEDCLTANSVVHQKINVLDFKVENCVPTGDNHTSVLYRVRVNYQCNKTQNSDSLIVKSSPTTPVIKALENGMQLFSKEMQVYNEILPSFYEVLGSKNTFSAKILKISTRENGNIIVMEDLKASGFEMCDRRLGLNYEHCSKALEKLATLHASSVVANEKTPKMLDHFTEGVYCNLEIIHGWILLGFKSFVEKLMTWPGYEKYAEKLSKFSTEQFLDKLSHTSVKSETMNVLNHGDAWTNNMMFLYDNKKQIVDMKLVDFQMIIHSSPVLDLHYFLSTTPQFEVLKDIETLMDYYYAQLLVAFARLKYSLQNVPTREQIRKEFNDRSFYGVVCISMLLPLFRAPRRADGNFEEFVKNLEEGSFRDQCYSNEEYRRIAQHMICFYDKIGALD